MFEGDEEDFLEIMEEDFFSFIFEDLSEYLLLWFVVVFFF